jgi:tRNA threonylcarbamoyladenosine biosynthesis protein TsaB
MILCLETATSVCSAALISESEVMALRESNEERSHASQLTVFIKEILEEKGIKAGDLKAIAVSKGPGSFTGLRIGVSVAKGIAYASSIPLIGIETTLSMYYGIRQLPEFIEISGGRTLFCPMIDARRMEVYYSVFDSEGNMLKNISADIIDENSFSEYPPEIKMIFFGDGAMKYNGILKRSNIYFAESYRISASSMRIPAFQALKAGKFENVAYFEPLYFKDFIATRPFRNILG